MIRIESNRNTPIYRQVIDQVKMHVVTGQLQPGEQLESVSSLASRLKVNPMTISKAFSALVDEGVAERRRGIGIFIAAQDPKKSAQERRRVLTEALAQAAALVIRLDVDPDKALALFHRQIEIFASKSRSRKP